MVVYTITKYFFSLRHPVAIATYIDVIYGIVRERTMINLLFHISILLITSRRLAVPSSLLLKMLRIYTY
jgi:hypothetical protein